MILLVVASYSDQRGEWIADQATLQRRARLGRRRVQQILDELVASGELAVVSHHGRGKLSVFRLLVGPENAQPAAPFPAQKGEAHCAFSHPPCPPSPPHPPIPLNPPANQQTLFSPLPAGGGGSWERGGGEGPIFRVNLLLEEAGVPLPSPAQIGLWSKTLGGIEPLLDLLRRLIQSGLATKRQPAAYVHRVVMERAARPEPAPAANPLRTAGVDDKRREQAARLAGKRGTS